MGIWFFYLFAMIPLVIGGILFAQSKRICWQEWVISSAAFFLFAGLMQFIAIAGMTSDKETWSGQITHARHYAAWTEYYEEAIYRTEYYTTRDSNGKTVRRSRRVFSHYEPRRRHHPDRYHCWSSIDTSYSVDVAKFQYLIKKFGSFESTPGDRRTGEHASRMIGGDPNDYITANKTGWIEPITKWVSFENRIKASPTVFSYVKPLEGKVFPYPENDDPFSSDRLLGSAILIDKLLFDQMNARLGPAKRVNVIMIGFSDKDSSYGQMQEAEYIGGKKNDIVITFGGSNKNPTWVHVFGWTERDVVKRNLESIILKHGATNEVLPLIEKEIRANYLLKDWSKFDYIQIEPPVWSYFVFAGFIVLVGTGFWFWAWKNEFTKT